MAMLFSGIKTVPLLAVPSGRVDGVIHSDTRWKKVKDLTTIARAATTKASTTRDLGRRGRLTGRTMSDSCFHLLLRLSFSGTCGLPRFSLQRLNKVQAQPVLHLAGTEIVQSPVGTRLSLPLASATRTDSVLRTI